MRTPIGKTRQAPAPPGATTPPQGIQASRGVLGVAAAEKPDVSRWPPPPELAHCIAYFWMVRWDLTGQPPRLQETAPHPNVYLVFDHDRLEVSGVSTRKFSRTLESKGRAFGVKFRPGGFRPFLMQPVSRLTDRILPAREIFGPQADHLEYTLIRTTDDREILSHVHSFLIERVPPQDRSIDTAASLVELILATPEIMTVDDLSRRSAMNKRSLQRLFSEYVGVPPKWVIRRYRLHELIERLNSGEDLDWADLAAELGYFDQAHLINDFKAIVGRPPAQYRLRAQDRHPLK